MSVGALEPQFYDALLEGLGMTDTAPDRWDLAQWPALREALAARFKEKTQAEWAAIFDGSDACCAPVLPLSEAAEHPHLRARGTYVDRGGILQPAPAPRFSRTAPTLTTGPSVAGGQSRAALAAWGVPDVGELIDQGVVVEG